MPTYSYACKNCGHAFDTVQSFSEPSLTVCPECGGDLRKVYNSVGVVFKGSGFYRTDSRDTGGSASSSASPSSDKSSAKSTETTSSAGTSTSPSTKSASAPASTTTSSSSPSTSD